MTNNTHNTKLMLYSEPDSDTFIFYLLGIDTIDALSDLPESIGFKQLKFIASKSQDDFIYPEDISKKQNISDLLQYFNNSEFVIDDMEAELDNNIEIFTHDNYEVTLICPNQQINKNLIYKILSKQGFNAEIVLGNLAQLENQYIQVEAPDKIVNTFSTFEHYLLNTPD